LSQIKNALEKYIIDYLDQPNLNFYNRLQPCPYAKKAWLDNKVNYIEIKNLENFWYEIVDQSEKFDGTYDVVVCAIDSLDIPLPILLGGCESLNHSFVHRKKDLWLLSSQNDWTMILIQKLSMLDDAGLALENKGYYKWYEKNAYENFVLKRRKMRKMLDKNLNKAYNI